MPAPIWGHKWIVVPQPFTIPEEGQREIYFFFRTQSGQKVGTMCISDHRTSLAPWSGIFNAEVTKLQCIFLYGLTLWSLVFQNHKMCRTIIMLMGKPPLSYDNNLMKSKAKNTLDDAYMTAEISLNAQTSKISLKRNGEVTRLGTTSKKN